MNPDPSAADPAAGEVAVDYQVGYACKIKRRFSLVQLAPIVHASDGAEALIDRFAPPFSEQDEPQPLRRASPADGVLQELAVPPAEVAVRAEATLRFRRTCRDCPANLDRGRAGFGCFGALPLPVPEAAERALMAVVERLMEGGDDVDSAAAAPIRFVWDNGLDGAPVALLREEDGWFGASEPVVARVGPFLEKREVSSDQVLEVFLANSRFRLEYAVLFAPFLAEFTRLVPSLGEEAIGPGTSQPQVPAQGGSDAAAEGASEAEPDGEAAAEAEAEPGLEPEAAEAFVRYFRALLLAGDLGVDTHLTPLRGRVGEEEEGAVTVS